MEKQAETKHRSSRIMKFLPKAATSSVSFQNPPQDQKRSSEYYMKSNIGKGFSGPMVSMIPVEARSKPRNMTSSASFEYTTIEPTSPKISCMGNIKHKQHIHKMKRRVASTSLPPPPPPPPPARRDNNNNNPNEVIKEKKKKKSMLGHIFMRTKSMGGKSDAPLAPHRPSLDALHGRAPSLGNMKRFTSGRGDPLANFDWTAQIAPDSEEDEEEEDGEVIPFSTIMIGGGGDVVLEPRKEINLWKRRTMDPPRPLQLHT